MRAPFVFALASLPLAFAQNVINVTVGANGQLRYDPEWVTAELYDYVVFTFSPKNHTVTQSSFSQPCVPLLDGVNSGFRPVSNATQEAQQFQFQVLDTNPKWFFCQQTGHCPAGMVFAINPGPDGSNNSFAAFQALANSSSTSTTATSVYSTPPPQSWTTTSAVITSGTSTWTSTYTSYVGSPSPTYAPTPQTLVVNVGANGTLTYDPPFVSAALGDVVVFTFHAKNHTATQSTFGAPCQPRLDTTGQQGFDSGFMPVAQDATTFPTFNVTVNDTTPTWVYCRQVNHCGSGMVFAINPVNDGPNNFTAFQSLAEHINGTSSDAAASSSTQTGTSPSNTNTGSNAGISNARVHGAALVLSLVAAVAYLL